MSFISTIRKILVNEKKVYDLSRNEEFSELDFIGFLETSLTIDFLAFVKADRLTERQVVDIRDSFFRSIQIVSYDFGLQPNGRNPNGLLCFVFEEGSANFLIDFIKKQTRISHTGKSAVLVSWSIDVYNKQIHTHNNPISIFPPVVIIEDWVFPGLKYLKKIVNEYTSQSTQSKTTENIPRAFSNKAFKSFNDLEKLAKEVHDIMRKIEEIYKIVKNMPEHQSKYSFPNAQRVQIIECIGTYIENNRVHPSFAISINA